MPSWRSFARVDPVEASSRTLIVSSGRMPRLVIVSPEGRSEAELQAHNTLGRHPNNTVQVLDRIVSKEHAHIDLVDGRFVLRDLGSLNGTYVNSERVSERVLLPGDEISMGGSRILFDAEGAARIGRPLPEGFGPPGRSMPPPPSGSTPLGPAMPSVVTGPSIARQDLPPGLGVGGAGVGGAGVGGAGAGAGGAGLGGPAAPPPAYGSPFQPGPSMAPREPSRPMPQAAPSAFTTSQNVGQSLAGLMNAAMMGGRAVSKVTIAPGMVESHIRTRLGMDQNTTFLPEKQVEDVATLRRDYEKLRVSNELARSIGAELDIQKVLERILEAAFLLLQADRGVILLFDEARQLQPRAVRTRAGTQDPNEPVLISSTIVDQVVQSKQAVLSSDATVDSRFQGAHSIIMQGIRSSMAVPLLHGSDLFGMMLLDSQIASNAFTEKDLQLFQNVANQAAIAIQNSLYAKKLEQEAVTRQKFQRLLSPAIAQQVIDGMVEIKKGGENRQTTVLFSDIRGFTSMSESSDPQVIVEMLNEYFELMVEVVFKYEGTLDKFVGDEIMALFGAPVSHEDDPVRAVRTAIEMLDVLDQLNAVRAERGQPVVKIGIGINTGEVVAGYLGSSKALEYTVIGDTVNTGARLCSVAKAGQIIISHNTYEQCGGQFEVIELPPAQVKGKSAALKIYNVIGERGGRLRAHEA